VQNEIKDVDLACHNSGHLLKRVKDDIKAISNHLMITDSFT